MLVLRLLSHGWKQSLRAASRGQNTAGNIIVAVIVVALGMNLLGLGLFLHALLKDIEPGTDPIVVLNGWVVYYLGIDLFLRLFLQRIPGQAVVPYLTLRLKKSLLVHLLLVRSFFSFFNLLPWALILPFAVNAVIPATAVANASAWLATLGLLLATNSLLNLFLKKLAVSSSALALAIGSVIAAVFALDLLHVISLSQLARNFFGAVLDAPELVGAVLLAPVMLYALNFALLRHKMYLEDLYPATVLREDASSRYRFLESAGERGRYIALELKLFFRNRRARASLIVGLAVIPLGILFYGMMLRTERDPYPIPTEAALVTARQMQPDKALPGFALVTFRIDTGIVPPFAHPYVTGDHPALARWKPAAMPLLLDSDSTWSRSFLIEQGTDLRYCFTLGHWQTEEKIGDGSESPVHTMSVQTDTIVIRAAIDWKVPEIPVLVMVNLLYWGLLVTGILMFAYGQFFLAWNSTIFDALLVWRLRYQWILRTKALMLFGLGVISFILTIPYVFLDTRILLINCLAFIYNIGVNSYVLIFLAAKSKKRFELNEGLFSQQGKGAAQFVSILPMWIVPVVAYGILGGMGVPYAEYLYFGGLGLLGIVFHRPLLKYAFDFLESKRYEIASGFRQGGTA